MTSSWLVRSLSHVRHRWCPPDWMVLINDLLPQPGHPADSHVFRLLYSLFTQMTWSMSRPPVALMKFGIKKENLIIIYIDIFSYIGWITMKFCIYHDSCTILVCGKFHCDMMMILLQWQRWQFSSHLEFDRNVGNEMGTWLGKQTNLE